MGRIFGFLGIIVTLALAPSIGTANATVAADNLTNLIGMSAIVQFGAPLIVLSLLAISGLFAAGKLAAGSMQDLLKIISAVIVAIVGLTFMDQIVDYVNTLIGATASGFEDTIYGIIPLVIYVFIVGSIGYGAYKSYKGGKKDKKAAAQANW